MKALGIAATGMLAQQTNVDTISNNIANSSTTGYKRTRAEFADLMYQSNKREGGITSGEGNMRPVSVDVGLGVKTIGTSRVSTQGGIEQTDNAFDMAIQGNGYFIVTQPDGTQAYTRDGSFKVSAEGMLVTNQGYEVNPGINIPEDAVNVEISEDGVVSAFNAEDVEATELGQINVANFMNDAGLRNVGDNLLVETPASGEAVISEPGDMDAAAGTILQGSLESSNVDSVRSITALIGAQRAYEMNSKVIETADQMMSTAGNIR